MAVAFFVALGFGIVAPALPVFARDFGVGRAAAAAVISAFAFMRILFALPTGQLVDRFGERIVLANGIAIVAVSSALAGLANSYGELIALRGIGGVGSAMFSISAMSLLVRMVPPSQRGRALGFWQGGFLLGGITGPVLGGVDHRGLDPAAVLPVRRNPRRGRHGRDRRAARHAAGRAGRHEHDVTDNARTGIAGPRLPRSAGGQLRRLLGRDRRAVGTDPAVRLRRTAQAGDLDRLRLPGGLGGQRRHAAAGRALRRPGRPQAGPGLRLHVQRHRDRRTRDLAGPGGYFVGLALLGLGSGLLDVAPGAVVGDIVEGQGGPVFAAYSMSSDLGTVIGPVAAGRLADVSYSDAFGATAGILGIAAIIAALAPETLHRAAGQSEGTTARVDGGTSATTTT